MPGVLGSRLNLQAEPTYCQTRSKTGLKLGCNKSKFSVPFVNCGQRRRRKRRKRHLEEAEGNCESDAKDPNEMATNNDRLGTFLFPSPSSQQIAGNSASSRNKIALKPGHSLMDWIRLTHSAKDLPGVGGRLLEVTPDELAKHGKIDDAWICLKGKVYNITPYMEYHPGGSEELMRGAGKEATDLFNEVHKWVNFESMLEKCLVGKLTAANTFVLQGRSSLGQDLLGSLKAKIKADKRKVSANPSDPIIIGNESITPKYDWFQTEKSLSIVVYTKCKIVTQEDVVLDVRERDFRALFRLRQMNYILHFELEGDITPVVNVKIGRNSGCAEMILRKSDPSGIWAELGRPLDGHNTFLPDALSEAHFRSCNLMSKCQVTHDTHLFDLELPPGTRFKVPVGHHVSLQLKAQSMDITRNFTPVTPTLRTSQLSSGSVEDNHLYLMIKIYKDGAFTSVLNQLSIGENLLIADPSGTFQCSKLKSYGRLICIAAGTGFTPMVKVIDHYLQITQGRKVYLMLFNKTEQDIPWRDQIDKLSEENNMFQVRHILSEPGEDWSGERGRIRPHLLESFLPRPNSTMGFEEETNPTDEGKEAEETVFKSFLCVCGPSPFTQTAISLLEKFGYNGDDIHAFTG